MPSMGGPAPFFSILIPSYNRPEFVGAAVASVLASDFQDYEVIVSDDCSPRQAEIKAVLEPLFADPRVHFHAQAANLGEPANRAFLQANARGDWQVLLSDDDKLNPHALRVLAGAIASNTETDLFTFGYTLIDELDRVRYSRRAPSAICIHRDSDHAVLREFLCSEAFPYWFYQPATFCCHRRVRERITPNPNIGMGDDLQFLFDYVNHGGTIAVVPDALMCYRKMDVRSEHLQLNQSTAPLSNPYTRYRMLVEMEQRGDLCPPFRAIVSTAEFRRRFVYNALIGETDAVEAAAVRIGVREPHLGELLAYSRRQNARWVRVLGLLARCRFFVGLFGVAGGIEILRVATQRSRSRLGVLTPRSVSD